MKKILIIDEAEPVRNLVEQICSQNGLECFTAINGLDGNSKILNVIPDLIIMEKNLTRMDSMVVLNRKKQNPNTNNIPVIMTSKTSPDKNFLMKTIPYGVKKFIKKPMDRETLIKAISELLHINTEIDNTPCVLEVRLNENIVFVEVAMGLNRNRLEMVKYRIEELIKLHKVKHPLVLIMMTDIPFALNDHNKLTSLIHYCMEGAGINDTKLRILTPSTVIKEYLNKHTDLYDIVVEDSLDKVMFGFVQKSKDDLLFTQNKTHEDESINVSYRSADQIDSGQGSADANLNNFKIAIVDDDKVVHAIIKSVFKSLNWQLFSYMDGDAFLKEPQKKEFDLIILDLNMPGVNGFDVLAKTEKSFFDRIIVLTSSTQRNDVMKVLSYGIKNYMVKPINGDGIKAKAFEILKKRQKV